MGLLSSNLYQVNEILTTEKGLYVIFVPQIQSGGGAVNFVQIQKMLANLFHSRFSIFGV